MINMVEQALNPYIDIDDNYTLEMVTSLNEAEEVKVLNTLCDRLYKKLIDEKFNSIDFGDIDLSKGDIEKYAGYVSTMDCLEILDGLIKQFRGNPEPVNTIYRAIENLKNNKEKFVKSFQMNIEMPMVIYCTTVLSIVSATSMLISTCVEYIKSPKNDSFEIELDKVALIRSKDNLMLKSLEKFNKACDKGDVQKSIDYVIAGFKQEKGLLGTVGVTALTASGIVAIAMTIIPLIREIIYFFYYYRMRMSDYLELQGQLLEMNAYSIELSNSDDPEKNKRIADRQHEIAKRFDKTAKFIAVKIKGTENKAKSESKKEEKMKYKADDIIEQMPEKLATSDDSNNVSSSLF